MPHLAPLKWLILMIIFWSLLLLLTSMTWWQTYPKIKPISSSFHFNPTKKWPWT